MPAAAAAESSLPACKYDGPDDDSKPDNATDHDARYYDAVCTDADDTSVADANNTVAVDDGTNGVDATHDATVHDVATSSGAEHAAARTAVSTVCRIWDGIIHGGSLLTVGGGNKYS